MSREIPFLEMFAALNRWTELAAGVSGWRIVSAAIDQVSRSADLVVSGAAGAGPNLVREAQDMICRTYGLASVRIRTVQEQPTPAAPEKAEELAYLRKMYSSLLITGPFSIILGFDGGLMALNDRLKLRSMVVSENEDKVFIASEEAAIRVMEPDAENVYAPMGGEPVIVRVKEGAY